MKHHALMPLLVLCLVVAGCRALDGYRRSYTVSLEDKYGQKVSFGVTLDPPQAAGMAAELQRLERAGVVAEASVTRDKEQEALLPAAMQLATLTSGSAPEVRATGTKASAAPWTGPASPAVTTVWLRSKEGKLWMGSNAEDIARLRAAEWVDVPPPGFEDGAAFPWLNGEWAVPGVPRPAVAATERRGQ